MKPYINYECYSFGKLVGVGTAEYWEKELGISKSQISMYATRGHRFLNQYIFVVAVEAEYEKMKSNVEQAWRDEWDAACKKLRIHRKKTDDGAKREPHWLWRGVYT